MVFTLKSRWIYHTKCVRELLSSWTGWRLEYGRHEPAQRCSVEFPRMSRDTDCRTTDPHKTVGVVVRAPQSKDVNTEKRHIGRLLQLDEQKHRREKRC